jgi:hypothetical protein
MNIFNEILTWLFIIFLIYFAIPLWCHVVVRAALRAYYEMRYEYVKRVTNTK